LWWVLMNESKLSSKTGNGKVALLTYRRALAMIQSLSAADPGDRGHRHGVAVNELAIGDALAALGRANEAIATFEQAVVVSGILLAADPKKIESGVDLARINSHLGKSYLAVHDRRRASACFHRAKVLFDGVSASQSRNPVIRAEAAELADLLAKRDF
jgi:tetratricopeptide (TPR) repeat protein